MKEERHFFFQHLVLVSEGLIGSQWSFVAAGESAVGAVGGAFLVGNVDHGWLAGR